MGVDHAAEANARSRVRPAIALAVARGELAAPGPERAGGRIREFAQVVLVAVERMTGDEEADRLALGAQLLLARPRRHAGERRWRVDRRRAGGEEPDLARGAFLGAARGPAHDIIEAPE